MEWGEEGAFDIDGETVVLTKMLDGIYYGIRSRGARSRKTLLSPYSIARAAWDTSSRKYAWVIFDSAEACYAIRAAPQRGQAVEVNPEDIIAWLRPKLTGSPPHKIEIANYVDHLRGLGITVRVGRHSDTHVRFTLMSITTEAERKRTKRDLLRLDESAFLALNWDAYDAAAGAAACEETREAAGEAHINLLTGAITVEKMRAGLIWASVSHVRSPVTFHTHPLARYRGAAYEPPSGDDLAGILFEFTHMGLVWHFVTAPEGTYILRPSDLLVEQYLKNADDTEKLMQKIYARRHDCVGGVEVCVTVALRALREAGFVAYFRSRPCKRLGTIPDVTPEINGDIRREARLDFQQHVDLKAAALAAGDWQNAITACISIPGALPRTWLRARYTAGVVQPLSGHRFGDPNDEDSYPSASTPGPIIVMFFPTDIPHRIPPAALAVAKRRAALWPWMAFLSQTQVTVFRSDSAGGVEIYGPHTFAAPEGLKTPQNKG